MEIILTFRSTTDKIVYGKVYAGPVCSVQRFMITGIDRGLRDKKGKNHTFPAPYGVEIGHFSAKFGGYC